MRRCAVTVLRVELNDDSEVLRGIVLCGKVMRCVNGFCIVRSRTASGGQSLRSERADLEGSPLTKGFRLGGDAYRRVSQIFR